jgi:hypothetical protein
MNNDLSKDSKNINDLIPSESETQEIVTQLMQTAPMQIPVVVMQIYVARMMLKCIDRLRSDLNASIRDLEKKIEGKD